MPSRKNDRWVIGVCGLILFFAAATRCLAADVPFTPTAVLRFADKKSGGEAIVHRDHFIETLSPFDRQARLNTSREVSLEEHLKFAADQAQGWTDGEQQKVTRVAKAIAGRIAPWKLPLPESILLVKTSGAEESGASYCRGPAIVLSAQTLAMPDFAFEKLLNHELFHVLSNQNPKLRKALYAEIGFAPCDDIKLPPELASRKITNPDAPDCSWYITANYQGQPTKFVPVLLSKREKFDPAQPGGFISFLEFKLLAVEQVDGVWRPVIVDGKPVAVDHKQVPGYLEQVGNNTGYLIHPEEILADNFVLLTEGRKQVPTPALLEKIDKVLRSAAEGTLE